MLQWTSIKDQAIVGAIEIYAPAGAPDLAAPAAAPVLAPASAPGQAPAPQTLMLPLQPYAPAAAPAYAPLEAPAHSSTFLQVRNRLLTPMQLAFFI
jgi:hypothetical protein